MRIKEVLKEKGISVQELADMLGISRQALSRQIAGKCLVETLEKIATAINVPVWQLFVSADEAAAHKPADGFTCPECGCSLHIEVKKKDEQE